MNKYLAGVMNGDIFGYHDFHYVDSLVDQRVTTNQLSPGWWQLSSGGGLANVSKNFLNAGGDVFKDFSLKLNRTMTYETGQSGAYLKTGQLFLAIFSDMTEIPRMPTSTTNLSSPVFNNTYWFTTKMTWTDP